MPIFNDLYLIFVHIPKNAGRSVEKALLCGVDTPDGGRRNLINRIGTGVARTSQASLPNTHLIGTRDIALVSQHLTYVEMEMLGFLPHKDLQDFERFCICRNPFDRAISSVLHYAGDAGRNSGKASPQEFERMLEDWLDREPTDHNERAHRRPQLHYITDRAGNSAVPNILYFEQLSKDFETLMVQIGRPEISLPWTGKSDRKSGYRAYLTPQAKRRIETEFGCDLEMFGYEF